MKAAIIKQRTLEKFIMSEFIQGNLNTQEEITSMLILIQKKMKYEILAYELNK